MIEVMDFEMERLIWWLSRLNPIRVSKSKKVIPC